MITNYFILNENEGDLRHIGTIKARNNGQLNKKIKLVLADHFCSTAVKLDRLDLEKITNTHSGTFNFMSIMRDIDGEILPQNIEIIPTILY